MFPVYNGVRRLNIYVYIIQDSGHRTLCIPIFFGRDVGIYGLKYRFTRRKQMNEFLWELAWLDYIGARESDRKIWKLYIDAMPFMKLIRRKILSSE